MNAETLTPRWADPVTFELIQHALAAVAEQMAVTVVRTARSTVSKEVMDFSTALCNTRGELVAQGFCLPVMLGSIPAAMRAVLARFAGRILPGDVYVLNDPYEGGSHLPDIFMFKPVFEQGVLCGFACVVTHHADIGGIAPGGISAAATEIYQEGLLIPPLKLYDGGTVNETLMTVIARNVRVPDKVIGDVSSQVSACSQAEEGLLKVVAEHGLEVLLRHMEDVLDYSEQQTREALRRVPDGEFSFQDALDDDGMTTSPIPIRVTVRKKGDELIADFSESGPQARAAINMTRSDTLSCLCFVTRCLLDPAIPNNEGCFRPLKVLTVPGTIVDALPPAPVASRVLTMFRVTDALFGALAPLFPDRVPACGMAVDCSICVSGQDAKRNSFVQLDWLAGSWGGRPYSDGIDHVSALASNISNTPVELIESEAPLLVEEYSLVKDTEGAGRFRGGLAVTRTWRVLGVDEALLQVRSDRLKFAPYGLNGGQAGTKGRNVALTHEGERAMPSKFQMTLREGERIRMQTAGTGGWGDPLDRDPLRVAQDVQEGRVSLERARQVYGVVIEAETMVIDSEATSELRRKLQ